MKLKTGKPWPKLAVINFGVEIIEDIWLSFFLAINIFWIVYHRHGFVCDIIKKIHICMKKRHIEILWIPQEKNKCRYIQWQLPFYVHVVNFVVKSVQKYLKFCGKSFAYDILKEFAKTLVKIEDGTYGDTSLIWAVVLLKQMHTIIHSHSLIMKPIKAHKCLTLQKHQSKMAEISVAFKR